MEREVIKRFFHPHPLVLNEQSDQSEEAHCRGCLEPLFGPCFSCGDCQFHLHKKCARAPPQITTSPFHCKYSTLFLTFNSILSGFCDLCKENRKMFYYSCPICRALFDIKCAFLLHNIDGDFRELKYVAHQHTLTFLENPNDELKKADCYWCQKPLMVDSIYVCLDCRFYLHKKCAQLPPQLTRPFHRKHPLYIELGHLFCNLCQKKQSSLFYCCRPCEFSIDIECFLSKAGCITIEDKTNHVHQFFKLLRNVPFMCDACGKEGNYISHICSSCHIMVHDECISLRRIIKITNHEHDVVHNYFFQKKRLEKRDCGICSLEVEAEYGSYNCVKQQDCNYVAHVDCARYDVIDANPSLLTCVIERDDDGDEATKFKHFYHQHDLSFQEKIIEEDDDKICNGCMLPISTSFYFCSQCDFLLHKACAELPKTKLFWFHRSLTNLHSEDYFICWMCGHNCSGFLYKDDDLYYAKFCLRCASVSRTLHFKGHIHTLFFDFKLKGECNGCGAKCGQNGAYKCNDCDYVVDLACITLPSTTRHKCDEHVLELAFRDENDYPLHYYCDICEKERDPNRWFYCCAVCDTSAHPKCALGTYPFLRKTSAQHL